MSKHESQTRRAPLTDTDGEVRELTAEDIARMRPAKEVLHPELYTGLVQMNRRAGVRGPNRRPTKVQTAIRFDADVLTALRATGRGWQTRVNNVMRDWLRKH
ncbi:MAG: BrnA antitoxin family protein [Acidobacteriota bacterium]|jgi:uncharacterized protein (DUF4415 family)|nr:BrnA antitoxin family protein [Acidobacteriota bacterium]